MTSDLLNQGIQLMLVGMGTVFVFLTTLVLATVAMSGLIVRFQPEKTAADITTEEVAAISAAITRHNQNR